MFSLFSPFFVYSLQCTHVPDMTHQTSLEAQVDGCVAKQASKNPVQGTAQYPAAGNLNQIWT